MYIRLYYSKVSIGFIRFDLVCFCLKLISIGDGICLIWFFPPRSSFSRLILDESLMSFLPSFHSFHVRFYLLWNGVPLRITCFREGSVGFWMEISDVLFFGLLFGWLTDLWSYVKILEDCIRDFVFEVIFWLLKFISLLMPSRKILYCFPAT